VVTVTVYRTPERVSLVASPPPSSAVDLLPSFVFCAFGLINETMADRETGGPFRAPGEDGYSEKLVRPRAIRFSWPARPGRAKN